MMQCAKNSPKLSNWGNGLVRNRLKQFDHIACWIVEKDLGASFAHYNFAPECKSGASQALNFGGEIVKVNLKSAPAAGLLSAAVRNRLRASAA